MFLIDTNILAAEILKEFETDQLTADYLELYNSIPLMKRVIPDFILNECETLMTNVVPSRYNLTDEQKKNMKNITASYLQRVVDEYTLITPTITTVKDACSLYQKYIKAGYISFTDSLVIALARQNNYTIVSRDQRLKSKAKDLEISCFEPQVSK